MPKLALNFLEIPTTDFQVTLHCQPTLGGDRPKDVAERAVQRRLPENGTYTPRWTYFSPQPGTKPLTFRPFDNVYATLDALRLALVSSCESKLSGRDFWITDGLRPTVEIVVARHQEGTEVVRLDPYLLRSHGRFGLLIDFRFRPREAFRRTPRARQLSLAEDSHGRQNRSYYADRYSKLTSFVNAFHNRLFPLILPDGSTSVHLRPTLLDIEAGTLARKQYVVGSATDAKSQFMGVKRLGPRHPCPEDGRLYFVFREEDRSHSRQLFAALRGDSFRTFPGMAEMFGFPISRDNVVGVPISEYNTQEILRVRDWIASNASGTAAVPVVLTPFSRHDEPEFNAPYWALKHAFLSKKLPIQVVSTATVSDRNVLKWSTASIGLQVFAKLGGTPWNVRPLTESCLIIGIGQAHMETSEGRARFFAYSVLTDSSGEFEEVRVLASDSDHDAYIAAFSVSLRQIFSDYSERFSNFAVHTPFALRRRELDTVAAALRAQSAEQPAGSQLVAMKFNDRNRFFAFATDHNTRMPYESAVTRLSSNEFLVWFEGRQHGQTAVHKMVGGPMHVQFIYPTAGSPADQRAYLQDAINLSGANWRGFNAKSLPVSVYYAQLIARYLREFNRYDLPKIDVHTLTPWFL